MNRAPVMDERLRDRRESIASADARRRRRRVGSLAAAAGLLLAAVLVARSPLFSVAEVRVEGARAERAGEVRDAAAIRTGDNLLDVDLGSAATRVSALSWVADAEARRSPPSAVTVEVTPRQPVAVARAGGTAWLLDRDGVVIAGGTEDGLPVIETFDARLPPLGETVTTEAVRNALDVHGQLPPPVRALVDRYEAPSVPGLRLRLAAGDDGTWVRFGAADEVEAKARAIGLLLEELEGAEEPVPGEEATEAEEDGTDIDPHAVELDVRAPNNPVLVPDGDGGPLED